MSREFLLLLILYSLQFFVSIYSLSCVDESGKNVDFWFAVKFPHKKKTRFPKYFDGTRYAFYVAGRTDGWTFSNQTIRDAGSVFGRTLAPYYHKERAQLTWLFYSDQPPEGQCSSCFAHSKGVLMADSSSGFWLVHSVPRFPKATGNVYQYAPSGEKYGQSAMCLSLSLESLTNVVLKNFLVARPFPYALHIAFESSKLGKALKKYEEKQWSSDPWSILNLKVGSKSVMSLYKHPKTSEDIYFKLAQLTNQNVRTETWLRPPGNPMKSNCDHPGTEVENIKRVQLTFQHRKLEASFKSYKDHSKWAVSRISSYGCVGDLNRAESQTHRGGGVTCIMDSNVWNLFFEITQVVEKCPDDKDPP